MIIPNLLMEFEKFRHTREGFVQIILASQLIGERPVKWNTPYPLGQFGSDLLKAIYATRFQLDLSLAEAQVFWEFKLPLQRNEGNRWPDLAVQTRERLILFELKTEDGSIREGQVDEYLMLGRERYPDIDVDMIYITTNRIDGEPPPDLRSHYCNMTWTAVAALERGLPQPTAVDQQAILAMTYYYFEGLQIITNRHRAGKKATSPLSAGQPTAKPASEEIISVVNEQCQIDFEEILETFRGVESSGKQAALELPCESPNDAYRVIDQIKEQLRVSNENSAAPILHARAWVWTPESKGQAMTESGRTHDVEIRVSYHTKASDQKH